MSSYLTSLIWGTSQVDDAVDKATSELLPSGAEDIALNLEICDQIRSKSVSSKDAMRALKRRLGHKNPNVQLLALGLTDICIKNGGDNFLAEVASREFMDNLVSILKMPGLNIDVKNKILRLLQNWALTFEGKSNLGYVGEVYKSLQHEGFNFPPRDPAAVSSAMVDTQTAPEWIDSDVCLRCRTPFSFTNRKHHCRNCGQVFDHQCSSKSMPLPHFGITQDVRVCDSCFTKLSKKSSKAHRPSQSVSNSRHRSAHDEADAELQRAIQLSLEEVGAAGGRRPGYVPSPSSWQISEPPLVDRKSHPYASREDEEDDPDLKAAIEASLREANSLKPSAPIGVETPAIEQPSFSYGAGPGYSQSYPSASATPKPRVPVLPNYDLEPLEADAILTFSQTIEQVQTQGESDISRYPAVTELYDKANSLRPKLAMSLNDTSRKEQLLMEMHEKLSQAVRLYDKLLTEQVAQPSWRTTPVEPVSPTYQQPHSAYNPAYQRAPLSYNQWAPDGYSQQQQPMSPQLQAQFQPQPSYSASTQPSGQQIPQTSGVYVTSPIMESSARQAYQPSSQGPMQQIPPEQAYQYSQAPPQQSSVETSQQYSQFNAQYDSIPPAPTISAPQLHANSGPPVPSFIPAQESSAPSNTQSPPPFRTIHPPVSPSTVTRHNTYPASEYPNAPPTHSTSSFVPPPTHDVQQLQRLEQVSVPAQLPDFPAVPTGISSPHTYAGYGPPMTAGMEPERKEALLIDL